MTKGTQLAKMRKMKTFKWNVEKNQKLKKERGVSFEVIIFCIEKGLLLDVVANPNQKKYKKQKLFIVDVMDFVYVIPLTENEDEIYLHTIIPNRNMTDKYLMQ